MLPGAAHRIQTRAAASRRQAWLAGHDVGRQDFLVGTDLAGGIAPVSISLTRNGCLRVVVRDVNEERRFRPARGRYRRARIPNMAQWNLAAWRTGIGFAELERALFRCRNTCNRLK